MGGRFGGTRDVGRVCLLLCLANDPHWLTPKLRLLDPPSSPMVLTRAPVFLCVAQTRFMSCAGRYLPKRRADEYELHGSGRGERRLHRGECLVHYFMYVSLRCVLPCGCRATVSYYSGAYACSLHRGQMDLRRTPGRVHHWNASGCLYKYTGRFCPRPYRSLLPSAFAARCQQPSGRTDQSTTAPSPPSTRVRTRRRTWATSTRRTCARTLPSRARTR